MTSTISGEFILKLGSKSLTHAPQLFLTTAIAGPQRRDDCASWAARSKSEIRDLRFEIKRSCARPTPKKTGAGRA